MSKAGDIAIDPAMVRRPVKRKSLSSGRLVGPAILLLVILLAIAIKLFKANF